VTKNNPEKETRESKPTVAQVVCEKLDAESAYEFFSNEDGKPFVTYASGGQQRTFPVGGDDFRNLIGRIAWFDLKKKTLSKSGRDQIIEHAKQLAMFDGELDRPTQKVHLRVARQDHVVYYDRTADDYSIYRITADGRSTLRGELPVKFVRGVSSEPLVEPAPPGQGNFRDFQKLINLSDDDLALLAVYVMSVMYEATEYPMLSISGPYQSGKTTLSRFIKRIWDPTDPTERAFPSDGVDVWIKAQSEHIVMFGDVDINLKSSVSEALRMISTGGGHQRRDLFTTYDDARISACRPLLLNSIADFMSRQDVASRALFVSLPRREGINISGDELEAKFQRYAPSVLGATFDAMSIAIANFDRTVLPPSNNFRFPTGLKVAIAAEERLGFAPGTFLRVVNENLVDRQRAMILESNTFQLLQTILDLRRGKLRLPWDEFLTLASRNTGSPVGLPKVSRGWRNWLNANEEVLAVEAGITFQFPSKVQPNGEGSRKAGVEITQTKQAPDLKLVPGPF
jgi:hypothetical protein